MAARSLHTIALEIQSEWKNVHFAAVPYLDAMLSLDGIDDAYGLDPGKEIVMYFLCNARGWRGDTARRVKAELNNML